MKPSLLFITVISLLSFFLTPDLQKDILHAEHHPDLAWMSGYMTDQGGSCCGTYDCAEVEAKLISQTATTMTVEVEGVVMTLPQVQKPFWGKTHFQSHDNQAYWCFRSMLMCGYDMEDVQGCVDPVSPSGLYSVTGEPAPAITPENTICVFIPFGS